jgi:hypothetical protein
VGAVSGGIAAYISCPMEVAVVRMSNDSSLPPSERRNYKGISDTATRIIREEGVAVRFCFMYQLHGFQQLIPSFLPT